MKIGFDLHAATIGLAEDCVARVIQEEDGEKCFNLYLFMDILTSRLDTIWLDRNGPVEKFALSTEEVARYLWCCLALKDTGHTYPDRFRGMPVLD